MKNRNLELLDKIQDKIISTDDGLVDITGDLEVLYVSFIYAFLRVSVTLSSGYLEKITVNLLDSEDIEISLKTEFKVDSPKELEQYLKNIEAKFMNIIELGVL